MRSQQISFQTLKRAQGTSASIAERVLEAIADGTITVGQRLPTEVALAQDFGVSRPTIREALAALQFAGYIESRRGYGTVVVSATPESSRENRRTDALIEGRSIVDLWETRMVLEPHALAAAACDPDLDVLKQAKDLINGMRLAVDRPELHAASDVSVHRLLLRVCRNGILRDTAIQLVDMAFTPALIAARTKAWSSPDLPHAWANHHDAVYDAISSGNPEAARAASRTHLDSVLNNMATAAEGDSDLQLRIAGARARTRDSSALHHSTTANDGARGVRGGLHESEG